MKEMLCMKVILLLTIRQAMEIWLRTDIYMGKKYLFYTLYTYNCSC